MWCNRLISIFIAATVVGSTIAFVPSTQISSCKSSTTTTTTTLYNASDRRSFVEGVAATFVASAVTGMQQPAYADDAGDLAMPTEEEQKKMAEDEMAARLKRKAELQKKASKSMNFKSSFASEMEKQKELSSKTKIERRNALCEELGRGC